MTTPTPPEWYEKDSFPLSFHGMDGGVMCEQCEEVITAVYYESGFVVICGCSGAYEEVSADE